MKPSYGTKFLFLMLLSLSTLLSAQTDSVETFIDNTISLTPTNDPAKKVDGIKGRTLFKMLNNRIKKIEQGSVINGSKSYGVELGITNTDFSSKVKIESSNGIANIIELTTGATRFRVNKFAQGFDFWDATGYFTLKCGETAPVAGGASKRGDLYVHRANDGGLYQYLNGAWAKIAGAQDMSIYETKQEALDKYKYVDSLRRADSAKLEGEKANISALKDSAAEIRLAALTGNWQTKGNTQMSNNTYVFGVKNAINLDALDPAYPSYYGNAISARYGFNTDSFDFQNILTSGGKHAVLNFNRTGISQSLNSATGRFLFNTKDDGFTWTGKKSTTSNFNTFQTYFSDNVSTGRLIEMSFNNSVGVRSSFLFTDLSAANYVATPYAFYPNQIIYSSADKRISIWTQNGGVLKPIAFTSEVILKATTIPTSSSDTTGNVGDEISDNNYKYVKTGAGWKRFALSTF
jgi:hypothetical protein